MVYSGWVCLGAMVVAYGFSNLLQSMAAQRTKQHRSMHPSLLLKLASQGIYLTGLACQVLGFGLAFLARRELPLFLVQASVSGGIAVMALIGISTLKWRLPRAELLLLGLLAAGIGALVFAAKPGQSRPIHLDGGIALVALLLLIGAAGFFASRLHGVPGSVTLGALAGIAFGAAAVDSRALAGSPTWQAIVLNPLLYLLFAHSLTGQLLVGMAMQRGSTTAAVAAMDAASNAPAAVIGLALLGDKIWPGREWLAGIGFLCTLAAVIGLARFAQPQSVHLPRVPTISATASVELPPAAIPLAPLMLASPGWGPLRMPPPENPREQAETMQLPHLVQLADAPKLRSSEAMPQQELAAGPIKVSRTSTHRMNPRHPGTIQPNPAYPNPAYPSAAYPNPDHAGNGQPGSGHPSGGSSAHARPVPVAMPAVAPPDAAVPESAV